MDSDELTIFVFGATGYLGGQYPDYCSMRVCSTRFIGSVAAELTKKYTSAHFIGHARSPKNADVVRKYGPTWTPLVDSGNADENYAAISRAAAEADIVVNAANCDDLPLVQAILAGLEATEKKKLPIYLHVRFVRILYCKHSSDSEMTGIQWRWTRQQVVYWEIRRVRVKNLGCKSSTLKFTVL